MDESRINVWIDLLWETALRSRNKELFKHGIINLLNEYAPSLISHSNRQNKCSAESHALKRIGGYSICPDCDENISGG